jgi:transcriptional regulator with XRE-family HTH domain
MTTQERKEIKEWGRTVTRLRKNGTFADLIKAEIAVSDLTVKEIAAVCNTSSASINKWKGGEVFPAVHFLYRLAKCLHPEANTIGAYMLYTTKINAERD